MKVLIYASVAIASVATLQADADLFAMDLLKMMQDARKPHSETKPNDPSPSTVFDHATIEPSKASIRPGAESLIDSPAPVDPLKITGTSILSDATPANPVRDELQAEEDKESLRRNDDTMPSPNYGPLDTELHNANPNRGLLVQANPAG